MWKSNFFNLSSFEYHILQIASYPVQITLCQN
jgi:hypothetical protein